MFRRAKLGFVTAIWMFAATACSRPDNEVTAPAPPIIDPGMLFDPSSLVEIRNFADLPEGVRVLAGYMKVMSDNSYPRFLAGGSSNSSAIVAYEEFGYVPFFKARAYTKNGAKWVEVKAWTDIGPVNNLEGLLIATRPSS